MTRPPAPHDRRSGVRSPPGRTGRGSARSAGRAPGGPRNEPPLPPPLSAREIEALQDLLDAVPAPLEPLDVVMLDGYLCGVLLQPEPVPAARWLAHVTDVDARPLPPGFRAAPLHDLVRRRHAELDRAIRGRRWFDPWVFELDADPPAAAGVVADRQPAEDERDGEDERAGDAAASQAVYPWVAGFATAVETFPALLAFADDALSEPLALLYRHLEPDDLEDADALLEEIAATGPPADLADAVEGLVRAVLLLADVTRPLHGSPP